MRLSPALRLQTEREFGLSEPNQILVLDLESFTLSFSILKK